MDIPTPVRMMELSTHRDPTNVTLMLPTHRAARETRQDPIRLKNLLGSAEEGLKQHGVKGGELQRRLAPVRRLLDDELFWQHQSDGLAVLIGPDGAERFRLPIDLPERVSIDEQFHLAPMLPAVTDNRAFFLLALSPGRVQLFRGDRDELEPVEVPELPANFEDYGRYVDDERELNFHTEAPPRGPGGQRDARIHGHPSGGDAEQEKQRMLEFCRMVADKLHAVLNQQTLPLILACDQRVVPMYRQVNDYPYLAEEAITGSVDAADDKALHAQAWEIARRGRAEAEQRDRDRLQAALAARSGSDKLEEVVPAASEGRVETLWVAADRQQWGHFAPEDRSVSITDSPGNGDRELLNQAAVDTFCQGGTVYVRPFDSLPTGSAVAAIMRY